MSLLAVAAPKGPQDDGQQPVGWVALKNPASPLPTIVGKGLQAGLAYWYL
jgi:hypothetical protein